MLYWDKPSYRGALLLKKLKKTEPTFSFHDFHKVEVIFALLLDDVMSDRPAPVRLRFLPGQVGPGGLIVTNFNILEWLIFVKQDT